VERAINAEILKRRRDIPRHSDAEMHNPLRGADHTGSRRSRNVRTTASLPDHHEGRAEGHGSCQPPSPPDSAYKRSSPHSRKIGAPDRPTDDSADHANSDRPRRRWSDLNSSPHPLKT